MKSLAALGFLLAGIAGFSFAQTPGADAALPPPPRPHLVAPDPTVLAKEQAAWKLLDEARQDGHTTDQKLALLDQCQAALGSTNYEVEGYRAFFLAMAKRWDEAFRQGERMRRLGFIDGGWLTDPQYAEIKKDPRWAKEFAECQRLQMRHLKDFDFTTTGLWTARSTVTLRPITFNIAGDALYKRLSP